MRYEKGSESLYTGSTLPLCTTAGAGSILLIYCEVFESQLAALSSFPLFTELLLFPTMYKAVFLKLGKRYLDIKGKWAGGSEAKAQEGLFRLRGQCSNKNFLVRGAHTL